MRIINGVLIDPFALTVSQVEYDGDDITAIHRLLSHESMKVDTFTAVNLDRGDAIFVDDDGLSKPCDRFFLWRGYHEPLAGKGLVIGSDSEGDSQSPKMTLIQARNKIIFTEHVPGAGLIRTGTPWKKKDTTS
jgi:hypothetical protein